MHYDNTTDFTTRYSVNTFIKRPFARIIPLIILIAFLTACDTTATLKTTLDIAFPPQQLRAEIIGSIPHDPSSFIEGLFLHNGEFYESAGLYGSSSLRRVDPKTGEVLQITALDSGYFAEGIAMVGDTIFQLTYQTGDAFLYDAKTFTVINQFKYKGEGWGLCYDGSMLWMSNGSENLTARDPKTFEVIREIAVSNNGFPVTRLNELECVGNYVYANVWYSNQIMQIDKLTGRVVAVIDVVTKQTIAEEKKAGPSGVLNGIAYDATTGNFWITGKLWSNVYEVKFVPK